MAKKVFVVAGPTASGKTKLAIELAKKYNGEIVSADSMQVYRRMDIGTAKADAWERAQAVHHMLDVAEPWEEYSVSRYVQEATACCEDILSRGKLPIICGGTGQYIDALVAGLDFADRQEDMSLRQSLYDDYERLGGGEMLRILAEFDPERAQKLHPSDMRRIVRAIEIYRLTGVTMTEHDRLTRERPKRYEPFTVVLSYKDRARLYEMIDRRVDLMVERGLYEEVQTLLNSGLSDENTAMQAIGYKEAVMALRDEISREEAAELIKQNSRRYAKRQLTWFRRNKDAQWIEWEELPDNERALRLIEENFG